MAPDSISSACLNIAGIAMLPTAENPVKNLAASAQLFECPPPQPTHQKEI
jgi:hypothetical protein